MLDVAIARTWYPASDPVHGFDHVLRVYVLAERLALEEGADLEIVRAAALLHDVQSDQLGKPADNTNQPSGASDLDIAADEGRANHQNVSAEFAGEVLQAESWPAERIAAVQHCIRAHRFRDDTERPETLEAKVLFDADKLDAMGAIGVARAVAYATLAGQPLYAQPSDPFLTSGVKQPNEAHSAYHEYLFKLVKLKDRLHTDSARRLAQDRHRMMVAYFEQLAAEMRAER